MRRLEVDSSPLSSFRRRPESRFSLALQRMRRWLPAGVYPELSRRAGMTIFHFASRRGISTIPERDIKRVSHRALIESSRLQIFFRFNQHQVMASRRTGADTGRQQLKPAFAD